MAAENPRAAACLYARDEARDVGEWLAFQLAVGFDCCIVYDNGSADRTPEIVRSFAREFDVRLIDWPSAEKTAQPDCYQHCLRTFGDEFDWIGFTDADELIVSRQGDVKTLLASAGDASSVVLNWAMFGSSGHATRPPGLMIETFKRRAKSDFFECRMIKQIVRPRAVVKIHLCVFSVEGPSCTPAGRPVVWGMDEFRTARSEHSVAQVSHFFTKDKAEWERKLVRGYRCKPHAEMVRRSAISWRQYDRNELLDLSALRFAPAVRAILDRVGVAT